MSFMGKGRTGGVQPVDKKKLDGSIILFNRVYKEAKALDSIVTLLSHLKTIFRAHQLCLFVLAPDLQLNLFRNPKERRQNYKKIFVNGGTHSLQEQAVYALFASEEDYCAPVFKDLDEAACHMFNSKVVLIPLKSRTGVKLSLQIVHGGKGRGEAATGASATGRISGATGATPDRTLRRSMKSNTTMKRAAADGSGRQRSSRAPHQTSYPQGGGGRGLNMSEGRARSLSGAAAVSVASHRSGSKFRTAKASPAAVGWTRNDYNLLKILANYLHMNVDYFNNVVIQEAKEKKINEIIDFALDIMHVKTFRQLIKKVKQYQSNILGFDECALYFEQAPPTIVD